jgi:small neutral amino acid transporter SnatA (MarC family)
MTEALFLLLVFAAVLGPLRIIANPADSAVPAAGRRLWAARAVGMATLLVLPLAVLGPALLRLGFSASALGLVMALILLAGAAHGLASWPTSADRPAGPSPAGLILTPSGVAAALLLPVVYPPLRPSPWVVMAVLAAVMGLNLIVLTSADRIRRRVGSPTLRVAAWTVAILIAAFSVQSMARSVSDLVCDEVGCDAGDGGDPVVREMRALALRPS